MRHCNGAINQPSFPIMLWTPFSAYLARVDWDDVACMRTCVHACVYSLQLDIRIEIQLQKCVHLSAIANLA